jgi:hypothetical protein
VKSESLALGGVMMMPVINLDDDPHLRRCVPFAFGSQGGCVLPLQRSCSMTVGEGGCTGFRSIFHLLTGQTLFFLINKNGKYFGSFLKNIVKKSWYTPTVQFSVRPHFL